MIWTFRKLLLEKEKKSYNYFIEFLFIDIVYNYYFYILVGYFNYNNLIKLNLTIFNRISSYIIDKNL